MSALADKLAAAKSSSKVTPISGAVDACLKVVVARRFSDITEEAVEWLWQDWIAKGKLHLVAGVQGDGKSTVLADIAARLSSGAELPNGGSVDPCKVGFLISEDGISDTVLPRLRIHLADLDNIFALESIRAGETEESISFAHHLPELERFIVEQKLEFVVVDALSDFMGGVKRNDEGEVRSILTPLAQLAGRTQCAIAGIVHLGKPGAGARRAVERVLGSGAFTQVARIVWAVSVDPEDETKRYFGQVKNNLAPEVPTLAWHRDRDQPITWDGEAGATVKSVMSGAHEKSSKVDRAVEFLADLLKGGGKPSSVVFSDGKDAGIGRDALYQASNELGVVKAKEATVGGQWYWRLPPGKPNVSHTPSESSVSSETSGTSVSSGRSTSDVPELPEDGEVSEPPTRDDVRAEYDLAPGHVLLSPEDPLGNVKGTAAAISKMTPEQLAEYRAEVAAAADLHGSQDPDVAHDLAALEMFDRMTREQESMKREGEAIGQVGRSPRPAPTSPPSVSKMVGRLRSGSLSEEGDDAA